MDPVLHFIKYLRKTIPGIKLVEKKNSRLMKFLGFVCFFNKNFMTTTTTFFGNTIYLPTHIPHDLGLMQIIAHEYVHICDMKRMGKVKFLFLYLFPQSLILIPLLILLAWRPSDLFSCASLIIVAAATLIPGHAHWRIEYEQKAYAMTLLFDLWVRSYVSTAVVEKIVDIIHGPSYYWSGGNKKHSMFYFEIVLEDARRGILPVGDEFQNVWKYLNEEKYAMTANLQT